MTHIYTLNELLPILYHTPRLNRLDCFYLIESNKNIENEISLTLPNLTYLRIWHCHVKFDKFKLFLKRICSQLRVLNITECPDVNYMDLNQWKDFTMENMVHLRRFYLTCRIVARAGFDQIYFDTFTDQFYSQFWKERRWIFKLQIRYQVTLDYILDQKKELTFEENMDNGIDFNRNILHDKTESFTCCTRQKINDSSNYFHPTVELCFIRDGYDYWYSSFTDELNHILSAIPFNSLYVYDDDMSIDDLVDIMRLLPNLDVLKVSAAKHRHMDNLFNENAESFGLVSVNNKITKVWQFMDFEQTNFLIKLCPQMEHLQIKCVKEDNLEMLVRFILIKAVTEMYNLHLLNLDIPRATDQMIDKLRKMISSEKLLSDYIIKRFDNIICLQWKF